MSSMRFHWSKSLVLTIFFVACAGAVYGSGPQDGGQIYAVGQLKPVDSQTHLRVGDQAPDFILPSIGGEKVSLSGYLGEKHIVLSFVPAAWTPVCSGQWPGYNIARDIFEKHEAILLGISVDNLPTLYAWTQEMGGVWFPVLSDFWPHGKVAKEYGVLRSDGTAERAIFVIDKQGAIRYIDVHDINQRPQLEVLVRELEKLRQ
ncbi:peroxiredoxin [Desulfoferrobacter suflitae]|uniref:peroxiredoxin n=1 Tax=Desulfoferrobacter suflitae TaxID=2865782 RepID=UPI002164E183|nr:peroxiredoxin [Desulfoferrobacter suflitae]MCK8603364.1 peroxiredoxin [Desulfoferrobacter suflitae]